MLCCGVLFLLPGRGASLSPRYGSKARNVPFLWFWEQAFLASSLVLGALPLVHARPSAAGADPATCFRPVSNILISLNDAKQNGAARSGFANSNA